MCQVMHWFESSSEMGRDRAIGVASASCQGWATEQGNASECGSLAFRWMNDCGVTRYTVAVSRSTILENLGGVTVDSKDLRCCRGMGRAVRARESSGGNTYDESKRE
jgi:hypothetical protein